mmetsp:Transcript_91182/g.257542  ORF Transcript_91182/g.257542 Transcript_91182/m.257542 type:complete len:216 (+) Transcript_91182:1586-2233(+)
MSQCSLMARSRIPVSSSEADVSHMPNAVNNCPVSVVSGKDATSDLPSLWIIVSSSASSRFCCSRRNSISKRRVFSFTKATKSIRSISSCPRCPRLTNVTRPSSMEKLMALKSPSGPPTPNVRLPNNANETPSNNKSMCHLIGRTMCVPATNPWNTSNDLESLKYIVGPQTASGLVPSILTRRKGLAARIFTQPQHKITTMMPTSRHVSLINPWSI